MNYPVHPAPAHLETAVELGRLRTELQGPNATMGRIADAVEKTMGDHESRLRIVESAQLRTAGVLKLLAGLGLRPRLAWWFTWRSTSS